MGFESSLGLMGFATVLERFGDKKMVDWRHRDLPTFPQAGSKTSGVHLLWRWDMGEHWDVVVEGWALGDTQRFWTVEE